MSNRLNREAIRTEYMEWEGLEVLPFYNKVIMARAGKKEVNRMPTNWNAKTKGWRDAKQEIINKAQEEADKKMEEILVKKYTVDRSKLIIGKGRLITYVLNLAKKVEEENMELSTKDTKELVNIIKTELGEPSTISKNTNDNTHTIAEMTLDEQERVNKLLAFRKKGPNEN